MIKAAFASLGDMLSPEFRALLWRALGLTLTLFVVVFLGVEAVFWFLTLLPYPWLETLAAIGAGLGLVVVFFFLMAPVTAIFAGLFIDDVAARVEAKHYSTHPPGKPLSPGRSLLVSLKFALVVLLVNVFALPFIFTGFGAIVLVSVNAYLISREYFEMVAMRFMSPVDAQAFRKENAYSVFVAGFIPALMALVPILNLAVPLFSTSYFVHLFKEVRAS